MQIGLFFGSFNPVHNGHLIIANYILNFEPVDQLWFVISPQNPLKNPASLLNQYHRLNLVKLAIQNDQKIRASDVEFHLPVPSYTIDTLSFLKEKYPQHQFLIIIGSDSYKNLSKWKNYEQIINDSKLLVYLRPGFPIETDLQSTVKVVNAKMLDISSTYIRLLIQQRKNIRHLVPDAVFDEIYSSHYYQ